MNDQEIFYTIALTRLQGVGLTSALHAYRALGSAQAIYEQRGNLKDVMPDLNERLATGFSHWDDALHRAAAEMEFMAQHGIKPLTQNDNDYPARLRECDDAPLIVFYKGNAELNRAHVINIVGTRHCTAYGKDLIHKFITGLKETCPDVLIISGLAYGADICAHREAIANGLDTVGVLAHGLDTIYPGAHRDTAVMMLQHGGLLTEYITQTQPIANNFRQRNRIVAGMSDATIVVESAYKGGALITARIAMDYGRDVMAFPGAVGAPYSEGTNNLIRDNRAALITSGDDFINMMGWKNLRGMKGGEQEVIERSLFPDLSEEEQVVVDQLKKCNDLQLNVLSVKTNIPIGPLTALLFTLEMKGVVKPYAGGTYHLIM